MVETRGAGRELGSRYRGVAAARGTRPADGRGRKGQAPARCRPAHGARADRRACSTRTASTRSAPSRGAAATATMASFEALQPANFVFGRGRIDGRPVVVGGDDFTVRGGAADAAIWQKQVMSEQMANELRLPLVRLVDGTGGGGSVKTIESHGYTYVPANPGWNLVVDNMGVVPVVALALGSVAGLGAARLASSHYSLMVEGISHMFIAGPPVVARIGKAVTKDELGGSDIHARAGAVDDVVASEAEAFARARRFLSYLPSSVYELPPRIAPTRRRSAARSLADRGGAARPAQGLRHAPHPEERRRHGLAVRDGPQVRRPGDHRARKARRLAGRRDGERSLFLRRRLDRGCGAEGHTLRRSRQHVPSAGGASGRRAGLRDRTRGREGRARSARVRARSRRSIRPRCRGAR